MLHMTRYDRNSESKALTRSVIHVSVQEINKDDFHALQTHEFNFYSKQMSEQCLCSLTVPISIGLNVFVLC